MSGGAGEASVVVLQLVIVGMFMGVAAVILSAAAWLVLVIWQDVRGRWRRGR